MDLVKERKWSKLRGRLYDLGYDKYLGAESVPLVQELFSDLVHTTESLRDSQRSMGKSEKESQNSDVLLAHENQDLQLELRMVNGEKAHLTKELKAYIAKLASQKSLNKEYIHKIQCLEEECNEKARIVQQLSRKNPDRSILSLNIASHAESSPEDPYAADLLQSEPTKLKPELGNSQEQIQLLNNQIDELFQTNHALEQELNAVRQKSSSKVVELTSKNHELCQEIVDIRNLAEMMEMEKQQKLKAANMEVENLKDIIRKHQEVIKDLEDQLGRKPTTPALQDIEYKAQPVAGDHQGSNREKLEEMVDFLAAEKSRLQDKLQKMMALEKVLVLELEGWRAKYGVCGRDRSPSRLDAFVKSLEEERDQYRLEAEHYRNTLFSGTGLDRKRSHGIESVQEEPGEIRELKEELRQVEENLQQVTKEKVSLMEELNQIQDIRLGVLRSRKRTEFETEQNCHSPDEISDPSEADKMSEAKSEQELSEKDLLAKELELQFEQHTSEMIKLQMQLRKANEKIQQLAIENESQVVELRQKQVKQAAASAEIVKLKEALRLAKGGTEETPMAVDPLMEELKYMQQQHEKQMAVASGEIVQLEQKLQRAKEKIQELEELKTQNSETSAEILTLTVNLKRAEQKVQQVNCEKDLVKEEFKQQKMQQEHRISNALVDIADLKQKLRVAEAKIQQLTVKNDSQMEEFQNAKQSKASAEMLTLKEKIKMTEDTLKQLKSEKERQMEELKKVQLKRDEQQLKTSAEILKLEEKITLSEDQIQQMKDEKDSLMEQLKRVEQSSNASAEVLRLKLELREANKTIHQLTSEKDSLTEELKQTQLQKESLNLRTSAEIAKLTENIQLSEGKIKEVMKERDSFVKELEMWRADESSNVPAIITTLKEKLRAAQEKVYVATSEKDILIDEFKLKTSSITSEEMSKQKLKIKVAEENIQQYTKEVDSLIQELKKKMWSFTSDEISNLKEKLRLSERNVQELTGEKDSLMEELNEKNGSIISDEISNLKENLRLKEENIQQLTEEKDAQISELKNTIGSITTDKISKLKEELRLAEEKIQQLIEEKNSKVEQQQREDQSATESCEVLSLVEERNVKNQNQSATESVEVLQLKEKLRLAEDKIQQLIKENNSMVEQYKDQNSPESAEVRQLKEKLRLAEEKNSKFEEKQSKDQTEMESVEVLHLKEKLRLTEEKIQLLTNEKDRLTEQLKQKTSSDTSIEISDLKENLRQAKEKIQRLMEERQSQQAEWKKKQLQRDNLSANKFAEILKLREKLKLAEEKIQHLTEEKDTQQVEWERKQLPHDNQGASKPSESLKERLRQSEEQVQQMLAEKKSLVEEMKKFRLTEEKIQQVTAEKDSLMEQLQLKTRLNTSEELSKLKAMVMMADAKLTRMSAEKASLEEDLKTGGDQRSNTSVEVLQLKQKLKLAEEKIQQLTAEKESLREELRCGLTSVMPYEGGRDTRIRDTQDVVYNLKQENLELREQVLALREQVLGLRDRDRDVDRQIDPRSAALVWNDEEAAWQRRTASGLRRHQEQIQNTLLDLQQMLSVKTDELHDAHDQMKKLEDTIESLSQELYQHKQKAKLIEISYSALCIQKDVLQDEAAKKSKSLAILKEQLSKKVNFRDTSLISSHLRCTNSLFHQQSTWIITKDISDTHAKEMTTQKMQENHEETLGRLKRDKELIQGDYQKLQDDMATEKEASSRERDELKQKVHSYADTVARMENILKTKERQKHFHTWTMIDSHVTATNVCFCRIGRTWNWWSASARPARTCTSRNTSCSAPRTSSALCARSSSRPRRKARTFAKSSNKSKENLRSSCRTCRPIRHKHKD
ncbi:uncharacterized protein LOC144079206 isoform X2 [Stigmatopora argus]